MPDQFAFSQTAKYFFVHGHSINLLRSERNDLKFGNFCVIYAHDLNVYRMEIYYVIDKKYYMMDYVCDEFQTKIRKVKHFVRRYKNMARLILSFFGTAKFN